jgi:hypothetical protein
MNAEHLECLLDQALEATFPASDPIAVSPVMPARAAETQAITRRGTLAP